MMITEPLKIRNITLQNRIVMPPMDRSSSRDGSVSDDLIDHYRERAESTGLIIIEHEYVSPEGRAHPKQLSMAGDEVIEGYRKLADAIHLEGSNAIAQISHAGFEAKVENPLNVNTMTLDDIAHVRESFIKAALRTEKAGFDGVEIHCAHGYLLNQFYSPYTNKRTDEYGGSLLNRARLTNEIIRGMKEALGEDHIIAVRFGAYDYLDGGSRLEDIGEAVMSFENSGVDLLDISGGLCRFKNPLSKEPGWFKELSKIARDASNCPVILTGGVKKIADAEALLEGGYADLIGIGRAMLMDAKWSRKALVGID